MKALLLSIFLAGCATTVYSERIWVGDCVEASMTPLGFDATCWGILDDLDAKRDSLTLKDVWCQEKELKPVSRGIKTLPLNTLRFFTKSNRCAD